MEAGGRDVMLSVPSALYPKSQLVPVQPIPFPFAAMALSSSGLEMAPTQPALRHGLLSTCKPCSYSSITTGVPACSNAVHNVFNFLFLVFDHLELS